MTQNYLQRYFQGHIGDIEDGLNTNKTHIINNNAALKNAEKRADVLKKEREELIMILDTLKELSGVE